jgi:D-tagatose-1,6-bisphosphate aldolase subunit GatZ/KbaZ
MQVLDEVMLAQPRHWSKHYPGSSAEQRLLRRYGLSDRCRYYWGEAPVVAAADTLFANLDARQIPLSLLSQHLPEQYLEVLQGQLSASAGALVQHKIGRLLAQYARACNRNAAGGAGATMAGGAGAEASTSSASIC